MAYKRIFQLTSLDEVESTDVLAIDRKTSGSTYNISVQNLLGTFIHEAPNDGGYYVRSGSSWIEVALDDIKGVALSAVYQYETFDDIEASGVRQDNRLYIARQNSVVYYYDEVQDKFTPVRSDASITAESAQSVRIYFNDSNQKLYLHPYYQDGHETGDISLTQIYSPDNEVATQFRVKNLIQEATQSGSLDTTNTTVTPNSSDLWILSPTKVTLGEALGVLSALTRKLDDNTIAAFKKIGESGGVAAFQHKHDGVDVTLGKYSPIDNNTIHIQPDDVLPVALRKIEDNVTNVVNGATEVSTAKNGFFILNHSISGTTHSLTNAPNHDCIFIFQANGAYKKNDVFTVNGITCNINCQSGSMENNFFEQYRYVAGYYNYTSKIISFFSQGSSKAYEISATPTDDVTKMWVDSQYGYAINIYNGTTWMPVGAVWK